MAATGLHYKRYFIVLPWDSAIAHQSANPDGIAVSPASAAVTYGAPIWDGTGAKPAAPRIDLGGLPSNSILTTNIESAPYAAGFTVDGGGVLHTYAAGTGGTLYWIGVFAGEDHVGTTTQPIMLRRFATGFEVPITPNSVLAGSIYNTAYSSCRDASRTSDGCGFAYRNETGLGLAGSGTAVTGALTAATYKKSWERFYIRPRTYPSGGTNQDVFWSILDSGEGTTPALTLQLTSTGLIKLYNQGTGGFPGTLVGTAAGAIKLNTWARIDLIFEFSPGSGIAGVVSIFVNGGLQISKAVTDSFGLGGNYFHVSSSLGQTGGSYNGLEIDFDDWFDAGEPATLEGLDWTSGNHFKLLHPTGFGAQHSANWVGDWRSMASNPVNSEQSSTDNNNELVLTGASLSSLDLTSDYQDEQLGAVTIRVMVATKTTTVVTSQQLGISYGPVNTFYSLALPSITGGLWGEVLLTNAGGLLSPPSMYPVDLMYQASATTAQKIAGVFAEVEYLGVWGPEDEPSLAFRTVNVHNSPYPNSEWAKYIGGGADILSPVAVYSGTYAGNNLGQDINTKLPIHWWYVRPVGTSNVGGLWFSSMVGSHGSLSYTPAPQKGGTQFLQAADGTGMVHIAGSDQALNKTGTTYQWVGFSDPEI